MKGVVIIDNKVLLLKNERDEWELPGGKLDIDETPIICVAREIEEELSIKVEVQDILDSWLYHIKPGIDVVIITYGCTAIGNNEPKLSHEHKELSSFNLEEIDGLKMPENYKISIKNWFSKYVTR